MHWVDWAFRFVRTENFYNFTKYHTFKYLKKNYPWFEGHVHNI